jgi:hypothetical protein
VRLQDLDDVSPPRAELSTLADVRGRGRSLQRRRRATRLAGVTVIVFALAAVVAIARSDHHHATVSVQPTTTTTASAPMVYERNAEAAGIHYALLLHTPVVAPGANVRVELVVENRTNHVVNLADCDTGLAVIVYARGGIPSRITTTPCNGAGTLAAGGVISDDGQTTAPSDPGRYSVAVTTNLGRATSLLAPLDLQVVTPTTDSTPPAICSTEVSISAHPELPAPAGIISIPGLTKISSDAGGVASFKGIGGTPPKANCTYTAVGGVGQFWVLSAAIEQYGSAANVPLPVPMSLVSKHPGPAEVNVTVLVFRDNASAQALLNNPTYNSNSEWTRLPDVSIPNGFVIKTYSVANDGPTGFIVQRAIGKTWIEVGVIGAHLTAADAVRVANSVTPTP